MNIWIDSDAFEAGEAVECLSEADVGSAKTNFRNRIEALLVVAVGGIPVVGLNELFHFVEAHGIAELAKGDHKCKTG